jgi:hypothetical protein
MPSLPADPADCAVAPVNGQGDCSDKTFRKRGAFRRSSCRKRGAFRRSKLPKEGRYDCVRGPQSVALPLLIGGTSGPRPLSPPCSLTNLPVGNATVGSAARSSPDSVQGDDCDNSKGTIATKGYERGALS